MYHQAIQSNDDYTLAMAQHEDKLVVIKFYDQFCRACDEIRPRFEELSRSLPENEAMFFELEVSPGVVKSSRIQSLSCWRHALIASGGSQRQFEYPMASVASDASTYGALRFPPPYERFASVLSVSSEPVCSLPSLFDLREFMHRRAVLHCV